MAMRVSGINSGLDTDAIVQELVSAYSKKTEKVQQDQTKLSWKQEIWKSLNSKVYSLYTSLSSLRLSSAYGLRKVTSSDASKASVTADGNAIVGSHKLNVLKTAQSAYLTGTKISKKNGGDVKSDTTLSELGITSDAIIRVTSKDSDGNDVIKDLKVSKDGTMSDFVKQLQEAGLNANFDEANSRLFISSKTGGANGNFDISVATTKEIPLFDDDGNIVKEKDEKGTERVVYETVATSKGEQLAASNMLSFLGLNQSQATASADIKMASKVVPMSQNATMANLGYTGDDTKIHVYGIDGTSVGTLEITAFTSMKDIVSQFKNMGINASFDITDTPDGKTGHFTFQNAEGLNFRADNFEVDDTDSLNALATLGFRSRIDIPGQDGHAGTSAKLVDDLGIKAGTTINIQAHYDGGATTAFTIGEDTTIESLLDAINQTFVDADSLHDSSKTYATYNEATGQINFGQNILSISANDEDGQTALERLGFADTPLRQVETKTATKINGEDAEIRLNGEIFTSSTNSFTINGLTINAQGVTGDGDDNALTISVSTDNQGIYDKVKDFLTQYNNIINEITKLYNADSAYGYNPLTDDEKDSMSDAQIEKWETKIKDSLLRRDNTLSAIMNAMINAMNKSFTINGQNYNLTTFGIHTLGFLNAAENEQNAFHIDGDSEDENTSSNKEKLMKAINEDPDTVIEFMKQLTSNLYKTIDDNMQSSTLRSRYKIYNDKEMDKQYTEYSKKISEWEDRVSAKEDYYYKKFSKMETALAKLNSQTNSLAGLLGK